MHVVKHTHEENKKDCIYLECTFCPIMQYIAGLTSRHNGLADFFQNSARKGTHLTPRYLQFQVSELTCLVCVSLLMSCSEQSLKIVLAVYFRTCCKYSGLHAF